MVVFREIKFSNELNPVEIQNSLYKESETSEWKMLGKKFFNSISVQIVIVLVISSTLIVFCE